MLLFVLLINIVPMLVYIELGGDGGFREGDPTARESGRREREGRG